MVSPLSLDIMPGIGDWNQANSYHYLIGCDPALLMWEWFRRDRRYREDVVLPRPALPMFGGRWAVSSVLPTPPTEVLVFRD